MGDPVAWLALTGVVLLALYVAWDRADSRKEGEDVVRKVLREWRAEMERESDANRD